jgi:hypothetical protein
VQKPHPRGIEGEKVWRAEFLEPEQHTNSEDNRSISSAFEVDLGICGGYWPVGKDKKGLPKEGQAVPETGSGTGGASITMSDYSGRTDGSWIRASVIIADEAQYVSSPDRAGRRDLLLLHQLDERGE